MLYLGANNRATAATGMNEGSSRSHSVFTITVNQRDLKVNTTTSGKLVLVDLAGSEMVSNLYIYCTHTIHTLYTVYITVYVQFI